MATIFHQIFQLNSQIKLNPFNSLNPTFTQMKCMNSKPIITTTLFLKPSLKPLITPLSRGDVRVLSNRRPGSKTGGKKNRVTIGLECTGCFRSRYITEKRRVAKVETRKGASETKKGKLGDGLMLMLSKYCPKCRKHCVHKEVKLGSPK